MPPPGGIAGMAGFGSGFSATIASVVIRRPATDRRILQHATEQSLTLAAVTALTSDRFLMVG
jgi:hypothetical protein